MIQSYHTNVELSCLLEFSLQAVIEPNVILL